MVEREKDRIIKSGNIVVNNRINGDLAVSRAFGDFMYKKNENCSVNEQSVSCIPDIITHERTVNDNYIVFACDGVWDVYPDVDEFIQSVNQYLVRNGKKYHE